MSCDGDHDDTLTMGDQPALAGQASGTQAASVSGPLSELPTLLDGRYQLQSRIGRGGMGEVYRARHVGLDMSVAVKLILTGPSWKPEFVRRFETEARALGRLKHPNIVAVTDFGVDRERDSTPFLAMELLEGQSLAQELKHSGPLDPQRVLGLLGSIAAGLDHAHREGVLHADLKPANVFLARAAEGGPQVKILDFGLAHVVEASRMATRGHPDLEGGEGVGGDRFGSLSEPVLGTPGYVAPEILVGLPASKRSDIFALGVLTYETLTGERPYGTSVPAVFGEVRGARCTPPSQVLSSLPAELDAPILGALDLNPECRPRTAGELLSQLQAAFRAARQREVRKATRPMRAGAALVSSCLAAAVGLLAPLVPPVQSMEDRLVDVRFLTADPVTPDPRIVLVSIDDATLRARTDTMLADLADEVGESMDALFDGGVAAIAVDLLLPDRWGRSRAFAGSVVRHADDVVLAAWTTPDGAVIGPEALRGLATVALGDEGAARLFGFVNVPADRDGRVRRLPRIESDSWQHPAMSFAGRAAGALRGQEVSASPSTGERWIDFRTVWHDMRRLSWHELALRLEQDPEVFRGCLVVLGSDIAGFGDRHSVPHPAGHPESIPGFVLQAIIVDTLLRDESVTHIHPAGLAVWTVLLVVGVAAAGMFPKGVWPLAAVSMSALALAVGVPFLVFLAFQLLVPIVAPAVAVTCCAVAVHFGRRVIQPA